MSCEVAIVSCFQADVGAAWSEVAHEISELLPIIHERIQITYLLSLFLCVHIFLVLLENRFLDLTTFIMKTSMSELGAH